MSATREEIIACARGYLGVPWRHQGRCSAGLDCAGLVRMVAHDLGLSSADARGYGPEPQGALLRRLLELYAQRVPAWRAGDILLMRFARLPQHLAIATDLGIIHCHRQVGRVVEHALDGRWRARVVDAYAFPGVAN